MTEARRKGRQPGNRPLPAASAREPGAERARAARLLHGVVVLGRTSDQVMARAPVSPLCRELLMGSLRRFFSLERAVNLALHRPLKPKDQDLKCLMIVGAYQLRYLRIPDHAATFETVNACDAMGKPWARGLVNAVLRRCGPGGPGEGAERSFEHPEWLEAALRRQYPDAEAIMVANNQRAPMCLRINLARIDPAAYRALLEVAGIDSRPPGLDGDPAAPTTLGPETRILVSPQPAEALPGYGEGLVSVQDAGAGFAPAVLDACAGERVLDACAAPGGKLFHLRERCPGVRLTALDNSPERLARLRTEAARLGHDDIVTREGDAATLDWWDGKAFDRVLVDAPCSGTGTLRRHPDIKILRRERDVADQVSLQRHLLANLWRVLKPGGTLLYCTCSILAAENDEVVAHFLAQQGEARHEGLRLASGRATRHGWQLLPTEADTDGFYYARMTKARE